MATMLHSESRRLYSWWWDSHISPKNSKWLQENLTDMDAKVKAMIKLIEEDADSFARRAEMYYKKRPELMKLVEEFYRAYRALAERYDHLTGELRQAHGTMAEAFPNQVPFVLDKDSPSRTSECDTEPHTPDVSHPFRALPGVSDAGTMKRGLKQLYEVFGAEEIAAEGRLRKNLNDEAEGQSSHAEVLQLSSEAESLKAKAHSESERAVKAESEVQNLKRALDDMKTEKDSVFLQYQLCLEKLSNLEAELIHAQKDSERLNDQAIQAETEVQALKEALSRVEVEKDAALVKHKKSVEKISNLEGMVSHTQEDLEGLNKRAIKAENEAQYLNLEISRLESEKEAGFQKYKDCLEKISFWEKKISLAEEDSRLVKDQADQADIEVKRLRKALAQLNKEKDSSALQYQHCLKRIFELENEISCAQEDVKRLNTEILTGAMKLKHSEEKCNLLEMSNQSLRLEAENLIEKIAVKDQALLEMQAELEKLQVCVQDEHLRYAQIEAMLQTLQTIYSQSQEEHKALAQDLKTDLQMLKDLEVCKHDLEDEIRLVKDENRSLSEHKLSSTISIENLQNEILCMRKMKERLEEDVAQQTGQSNSLQKEISSLKEEMKGLNNRYQALMDQLEAVGLNPECIGSSVRNLQDENLRLRQICEMERMEKGALSKKIENMEELSKEKHVFESSLSELNSELEASHEKVREMRETCQFLHGEKSVLISEKAALLFQLQGLTQNMQTLLEKNAVLENSLSGAKIELEGLREKSKGLEEICQLLKNEKSNLQTERGTLVLQLVNVECRLEYLEKRFTGLEEKCTHLEKEKESMHSEVKKLRISLDVAKQERTSSTLQSETRLVSLEHHLHLLEEENRSRKKEFNDELDKAVKAQCEIFILQKFVQDMEQKNHSLLIECQKHVEASKLAEKLISDLERENLEQEVEAELLLDEIEKLRLGIYRVFKALDASDTVFEDKVENEQTFVHQILVNIEDMKHSLLKYKDDEQLLLVENSVLLTLLRQLKLEHTEIESKMGFLEQELNATSDKLVTMQNDKYGLLEMNRLFESQVSDRNKQVMILEEEMQNLFVKQSKMEKAYLDLQEKYSEVLDENRYLLSKFSELKEEKCMLELESDFTLQESLALSTFSTFLESYGTEKSLEQKLLFEDVENLSGLMDGLKKEVGLLRGKLEKKEAENVFLKDSVQRLEMELNVVRRSNVDLNQEIESVKDVLIQREAEILEAEHKFKAAENLKMEFCKIVDVLKAENQESSHTSQNLERHLLNLSEDNGMQEKEIEGLRQTNENLVFELCKLHEESEEQRIKEEKLSSELKLKNHEFEFWEAEAAAFYFDLQISSIHGVLYENKVHELTEVCESLESDSTSKTLVIEEMKGTISFMENEIGRLKAQLTAYGPIIASLRDGVTSLEHNVLSQTKLTVADFVEPKCNESGVDQFESFHDKPIYDQSPMPVGGIQVLRKLQSRIKAVEKFMVEEMKSLNAHATQETAVHAMEGLKPQRNFSQEKVKQKQKKVSGRNLSGSLRLQEDEEEGIVFKKRALMKDIPLDHISDSSLHGLRRRANVRTHRRDDQMLGLWETADCHSLDRSLSVFQNPEFAATEVYDQSKNLRQKAEHPSTGSEVEKELGVDKLELSTNTAETNQEVNNRKILERLASDAQKLTRLHLTVQNLTRKLDTNKQSRKAKDVDLETVKEQLQEIQETVVQLGDLNGQLMKNIEENPSCSNGKASAELKEAENVRRKKVSEQALKGSEKIARLQLEVQKLQYVLLKLEDEKKNKGKTRFSRSKTTIILRDFIYSGRKISGKRNKSHLCGCFRPTTPISNSPRI